jgi:hypothetical protein
MIINVLTLLRSIMGKDVAIRAIVLICGWAPIGSEMDGFIVNNALDGDP